MKNNDILTYFKKGKVVQLVLAIVIALAFILILCVNGNLRNALFSDQSLFTMFILIWVILILFFLCLFFDFYRLSKFHEAADESLVQRFMKESSGMLNRFSVDTLFNSEEVSEVLSKVGCVMMEIENLKQINADKGRDAGDTAIKDFCEILENVGNDYGIVVRNGGNEFLIVLADCDQTLMDECLETLDNCIALYNEKEGENPLDIHSTYVLNAEKKFERFSEILTLAYKQLHA